MDFYIFYPLTLKPLKKIKKHLTRKVKITIFYWLKELKLIPSKNF